MLQRSQRIYSVHHDLGPFPAYISPRFTYHNQDPDYPPSQMDTTRVHIFSKYHRNIPHPSWFYRSRSSMVVFFYGGRLTQPTLATPQSPVVGDRRYLSSKKAKLHLAPFVFYSPQKIDVWHSVWGIYTFIISSILSTAIPSKNHCIPSDLQS